MSTIAKRLPRRGSRLAWANHNPPLTALLVVTLLPLLYGLLTGAMGFGHWVTFTLAGVSMGMMAFLMASGLTLVFGLMNVMNLAHGAFIGMGAMAAYILLDRGFGASFYGGSLLAVMGCLLLAVALAALVGGGAGYVFERLVVKPVYGQPLKEILITLGGGMILLEMLHALNNDLNAGSAMVINKPAVLRGSFVFGEIALEKFRLIVAAVGLGVFIAMDQILRRTRIGLLVRAGVEKREMVEVLGYRITRLFIGVFMVGAALAAVGGVLWAIYEGGFDPTVGNSLLIMVIVVIIIGGLGSITGCFVGSLLAGLVMNYTGYLAPSLANVSLVLLLVAILMWRPQGLIPVFKV